MCLRDRALAAKAGKKTCRVPGCDRPACTKPYLARRRICSYHTTLSRLQLEPEGPWVRWCQQCRRFQNIQEFDRDRRSCKKVLATHNSRRYKREGKESSSSDPTELATEEVWSSKTLPSTGSFDTSSAAGAQHVRSATPTHGQYPLHRSGSIPDTPKPNDEQGFAAAFHAGVLAAALQDTALRTQAAAAGGPPPNPFAAHCFHPPSNCGPCCLDGPSSSGPSSLVNPPTPSAELSHPAFRPAQQPPKTLDVGGGLALGGGYYSWLAVEEREAPALAGPLTELLFSPGIWG